MDMKQTCLMALGVACIAASPDARANDNAPGQTQPVGDAIRLALNVGSLPPEPASMFADPASGPVAPAIWALRADPLAHRLELGAFETPDLAGARPDLRLATEETPGSAARAADPLTGLDLREPQAVRYGLSVTATASATGLPVDVLVAPRGSIERNRVFDSVRRGIEVRLGLDLEPEFRDPGRTSFYMFAGADNQVVTYGLGGGLGVPTLGGVKLEDKLTVGDVQTGVAMELYRVTGSISYLTREFSAEHASARSEYGALTLAVRW
jgi:hypothetical protein